MVSATAPESVAPRRAITSTSATFMHFIPSTVEAVTQPTESARPGSPSGRGTIKLCTFPEPDLADAIRCDGFTVIPRDLAGRRAPRAAKPMLLKAPFSTALRSARDDYGVAAAVAAGAAGAGVTVSKLKFTVGGLSAPGCALKNGFAWKPISPAKSTVGKLRTAVL